MANPSSLTDRVRASCARVVAEARHVHLDADRVADYARSLPLATLQAPEIDAEHHYLGHGAGTAAYLLTLCAINFGSGYSAHLTKRPGMSGYFTVATAWKEYFERSGVPSPSALAEFEAVNMAGILGQSMTERHTETLMIHFAKALADLGQWLIENYDGHYVGPIIASRHSAESLAEKLATMPYFDDVAEYHGFPVAFYKRAQIFASDLALAFGGRSWGRFDDLARLTIFADNLVPHVLRVDGLLEYDADLARRIDSEQSIAAGSDEEIEIRAAGVHACELIIAALQADGHDVMAMQLDNLLWNRGQAPEYKRGRPRHRTRSVFY